MANCPFDTAVLTEIESGYPWKYYYCSTCKQTYVPSLGTMVPLAPIAGYKKVNDDYVSKSFATLSLKNVLAEVSDGIVAAEDLSATSPIDCTIAAQPDYARSLTWSLTHSNITAFSLAIVGVNIRGEAITETFTAADGWSGETSEALATVTSVTFTRTTGAGTGDALDVGTGSKFGLVQDITATTDVYKAVKGTVAAYAADMPSTDYTVNTTYQTIDLSTGSAITDGDFFDIYYYIDLG